VGAWCFWRFFRKRRAEEERRKKRKKHQAPTREVGQTTPGIKSPHGWMGGFTSGYWCFHRSKDYSNVQWPETLKPFKTYVF
jgi:hypothetical protein